MNKLLSEFKEMYGFLPDEMEVGEERIVEQKGELVHFTEMRGAILNNFLVDLTSWEHRKKNVSAYKIKRISEKEYIQKVNDFWDKVVKIIQKKLEKGEDVSNFVEVMSC